MRSLCPVYISPNGPYETPFVSHDNELDYLRSWWHFISREGDFRRMSDFKRICFNRLYDRLYLVYSAPDSWCVSDFEGRYKRGSRHLYFSGEHNLEVFILPHSVRDGLYASAPESVLWEANRACGGELICLIVIVGIVLTRDCLRVITVSMDSRDWVSHLVTGCGFTGGSCRSCRATIHWSYDNFLSVPWRNLASFVPID